DFGMVPYEAFLAEKPVVTTSDAGGPLEIVADRRTGLVCEPRAASLAQACVWLRSHVDEARTWGRAGRAIAERVTWDDAIGRLLAYAVLDNRIPPLWETRPEDFPLAGEVLSLATGLIVHSRHVEQRARTAGFEGRIWRVPHPAWPVPPIEPADPGGRPLLGC